MKKKLLLNINLSAAVLKSTLLNSQTSHNTNILIFSNGLEFWFLYFIF